MNTKDKTGYKDEDEKYILENNFFTELLKLNYEELTAIKIICCQIIRVIDKIN